MTMIIGWRSKKKKNKKKIYIYSIILFLKIKIFFSDTKNIYRRKKKLFDMTKKFPLLLISIGNP